MATYQAIWSSMRDHSNPGSFAREGCLNLRKYLLLPRLIFYPARAPRDQRLAWIGTGLR
jgi:hypothetical protein